MLWTVCGYATISLTPVFQPLVEIGRVAKAANEDEAIKTFPLCPNHISLLLYKSDDLLNCRIKDILDILSAAASAQQH